jgi:hypothetical protein
MRWSKLKQRLEQRFAPEVGRRVKIHLTRYRESHDAEGGELYVSLDGKKIYGIGELNYFQEMARKRESLRSDYGDIHQLYDEVGKHLTPRGIASSTTLLTAAFDSLNQPIDEMLASDHPLIRGLAILDARCGKRRLAKIDIENEHGFITRLHALRLSA